jgi:arylsulfatase A-like enzyme
MHALPLACGENYDANAQAAPQKNYKGYDLKPASWISRILLCSLATASIPAIADRIGSGGVNAPEQRDKPYLILISIDGFRWDYRDLYETPAMDRLAARGIYAESLRPVFPVLSFPNHYSIATGLYPASHGIIANDFPDPVSHDWYMYKNPKSVQQGRWYGGEPIWVAAEKHRMVSAAFFWVGTEADIQGITPTYWNQFNDDVSGEQRVAQVLEWLAMSSEKRPHFISLYFEQVDVDTHHNGVGSTESIEAIKKVDRYISMLLDGIEALPHGEQVYIVLVSDHGQSSYDQNAESFVLDQVLELNGVSIIEGGTYAFLFFDEEDPARAKQMRDDINRAWSHGRAWLPGEAPETWHVKADSGFPDVIIQSDPHFGVVSGRDKLQIENLGSHGWPPSFKDMHGIFIAAGPRLPKGKKIPAISAVDIYPMMMEILEIPISTPIDGDADKLTSFLASRPD